MPLHLLPPVVWSRDATAVTCLFALLCLGIGEMLALRVSLPNPHTSPLTGLARTEPTWHERVNQHVGFRIGTLDLPNHWVWYDRDAVREVLAAQYPDIWPFLVVTVYNAAVSTVAVGMSAIFVSMYLAVRATSPASTTWRMLAYWPALISFAADLTEDIALLVLTLGFPLMTSPAIEGALAWASLIKFAGWVVMACSWAVMGSALIARGSRRAREDGRDA